MKMSNGEWTAVIECSASKHKMMKKKLASQVIEKETFGLFLVAIVEVTSQDQNQTRLLARRLNTDDSRTKRRQQLH